MSIGLNLTTVPEDINVAGVMCPCQSQVRIMKIIAVPWTLWVLASLTSGMSSDISTMRV